MVSIENNPFNTFWVVFIREGFHDDSSGLTENWGGVLLAAIPIFTGARSSQIARLVLYVQVVFVINEMLSS
jgi:hypothetical protein